MKYLRYLVPLAIFGLIAVALIIPTSAAHFATPEMQRTWEYTDKPVADGQAVRSWIWGPDAFTPGITEDYVEGSLADGTTGKRLVQYQEKSRMEITNPSADKNSIWYVTNGLLATELTSGRMQVGDNSFVQRTPAIVNVAGDANDPNGITYQTMGTVIGRPAQAEGTTLNQRLSRTGAVTTDTALDGQSIQVGFVDTVTQHGIAQPFWDFMNSSGVVYQNEQFIQSKLFENPFFATGRPITEAYWQDALVGGTSKLVLTQCFERRCLTYTPTNALEWRVEMGNIGLHYHTWRYTSTQPTPSATATVPAQPTATVTATAPAEPTATTPPATNYVFDSKFGSQSMEERDLDSPHDVALNSTGNIYLTDTNTNLIHKYDSNGAWLMSWGGPGTENGQFNTPLAITVDAANHVYVTDAFNMRVQKFDQNGNWLLNFTPPAGGFDVLSGIEADGLGNVYVVDNRKHLVYKYNTAGAFQLSWGAEGTGDGQFNSPNPITVSPDNNTVYVVDTGNNRVQAFSSTGTYLRQWGSPGSGDGEFNTPWGIGISPDGGTVYVTDPNNRRVQAFDTQGTYLRQWGQAGWGPGEFMSPRGVVLPSNDTIYIVESGQRGIQTFSTNDGSFLGPLLDNTSGRFRSPQGMTTMPNGDFVVVDRELNQVKILDSTGNPLREWGGLPNREASLDRPVDAAVDSTGLIFVTDSGENRIVKFNDQGVLQMEWGEGGSGNGQFDDLRGIDVDADGNVYIVDSGNNRIQKFSGTGTFITSWGEAGNGQSQFNEPHGIAVQGNRVYVVDQGNRRVQVFDLNGVYQSQFGSAGSGDSQFSDPSLIDVDAQGFIYISDTGNNRVQKFRPDGSYLAQFGGGGEADGQFDDPLGIVALPNGNVAVVDSGNYRIQIFQPAAVG